MDTEHLSRLGFVELTKLRSDEEWGIEGEGVALTYFPTERDASSRWFVRPRLGGGGVAIPGPQTIPQLLILLTGLHIPYAVAERRRGGLADRLTTDFMTGGVISPEAHFADCRDAARILESIATDDGDVLTYARGAVEAVDNGCDLGGKPGIVHVLSDAARRFIGAAEALAQSDRRELV
jgi:hypothetical protein